MAERKRWSASGSSGGGRCPCRDRVVVPVTGVIVLDAAAAASPPLGFNAAPPSIAATAAVPGESLTLPPPLPPPWHSMREGRPPTVGRFRDHCCQRVVVDAACTSSPPTLHSMQERRPLHINRCPGCRAQPAIATILHEMLSNPLLPPAPPRPPPPSPSHPPWRPEGEMAPRTTPRITSGGGLPLRRLAPFESAKSSRPEPAAPVLLSAQLPALCQQTG